MPIGDRPDISEQLRAFEEFLSGAVTLDDVVQSVKEAKEKSVKTLKESVTTSNSTPMNVGDVREQQQPRPVAGVAPAALPSSGEGRGTLEALAQDLNLTPETLTDFGSQLISDNGGDVAAGFAALQKFADSVSHAGLNRLPAAQVKQVMAGFREAQKFLKAVDLDGSGALDAKELLAKLYGADATHKKEFAALSDNASVFVGRSLADGALAEVARQTLPKSTLALIDRAADKLLRVGDRIGTSNTRMRDDLLHSMISNAAIIAPLYGDDTAALENSLKNLADATESALRGRALEPAQPFSELALQLLILMTLTEKAEDSFVEADEHRKAINIGLE